MRLDEVIDTPRVDFHRHNLLDDRHEFFLLHPRGRSLMDTVGEVKGFILPRQTGRSYPDRLEPSHPILSEQGKAVSLSLAFHHLELQPDSHFLGREIDKIIGREYDLITGFPIGGAEPFFELDFHIFLFYNTKIAQFYKTTTGVAQVGQPGTISSGFTYYYSSSFAFAKNSSTVFTSTDSSQNQLG